MEEKGIYFCEICELEFHDLGEFSSHCQEAHGAVDIEVVKNNIVQRLGHALEENLGDEQ